jgi:ATP-dependent RNA helicase DHX29
MIALHALTFPSSEGFAAGSTSAAGGGQTFFRLLPAVFRDLWDELEDKRKAEHDAVNRVAWAKLQSILDGKLRKDRNVRHYISARLGAHTRLQGKEKSLHGVVSAQELSSRHYAAPHDLSSEQLISGFAARYDSPAYQEMLVRPRVLGSLNLLSYKCRRKETDCPSLSTEVKSCQLWKHPKSSF